MQCRIRLCYIRVSVGYESCFVNSNSNSDEAFIIMLSEISQAKKLKSAMVVKANNLMKKDFKNCVHLLCINDCYCSTMQTFRQSKCP